MADEQIFPPPSQPFPGSTTPGWNDPPPLQSAGSAPTVGRRLNLKRVAFPLQGESGAAVANKPTAIVQPSQIAAAPPPILIPPPSSNVAVVHPMNITAPPPIMPPPRIAPIPAFGHATHPIGEAAGFSIPSEGVDATMRVLRDKCGHVEESSHVRREEINKRLGTIEQLWRSNNFSPQLQEKLYRLGKALTATKFQEAMDIYTSLVTNHSSESATWLLALRHVVLTIQPTSDDASLALSSSSTVAPNTDSSVNGSIPAMYVPAMPRHVEPVQMRPTTTDGGNSSSVQHI